MFDPADFERRLAAVERAVADLQQRLTAASPSQSWLEKMIGPISDEAAFLEAMEFGRAWRQADRPRDEPGEQP